MKTRLLAALIGCLPGWAFGQFNLQLLGHLPFPNTTCAGVWHYVDTLGNEYALIGAGNGLVIADVTNPAAPAVKFTVPANSSLWREVKTFGHYAYATTEGGGGITIVNLEYLPDSVQFKVYAGDGAIAGQLSSGHTVLVDDEGYLFVFGSNLANGGAVICDLNPDPWNPQYVGQYNTKYIHDGYVLNDTLWAGEIYAGRFSVIDVSNRANPVLLATQPTPGQFCHNTWLNDDHSVLFTTDEVNNAPLAAYDVSDIGNIKLIGVYFTDSMPSKEVHNVRVIDDFLVNPSYGSQLTIVDAKRPGNLIEIANYPTGPALCWDASPFLPSGNIIATDEHQGLYVFAPYYVRACYLEGTVTDSVSGSPINGAMVKILATPKQASSGITGEYRTGNPAAGTFDVEVSKGGYITKVIPAVVLTNGNLTVLDVELVPFSVNGQVVESTSGNPVPNAQVLFTDVSGTKQFLTADAAGNFSLAGVNSGAAVFTAGQWGYVTRCVSVNLPTAAPLVIALDDGYYDDFAFDFGWTVTSSCVAGDWERGVPIGTGAAIWFNPNEDVQNDCSDECYVTYNVGGNPVLGDVDDGATELASPVMDLTTYTDPYINYARWFVDIGVSQANDDTLFIRMSDGTQTVDIEHVFNGMTATSQWVYAAFRIANYITPGPAMTVTVFVEDKVGTASTLECGFDRFFISEGPTAVASAPVPPDGGMVVYPNPAGSTVTLASPAFRQDAARIRLADAAGRCVYTADFPPSADGTLMLDLAGLERGLYLATAVTGRQVLSKMLVKE